MLIALIFLNSDHMKNFHAWLLAGFIFLKFAGLWQSVHWNYFPFSVLFFKTSILYSLQCHLSQTFTTLRVILLLLKGHEPKEQEIITVQCDILGYWPKDELEFYCQVPYKKKNLCTNHWNAIPKTPSIFKCQCDAC